MSESPQVTSTLKGEALRTEPEVLPLPQADLMPYDATGRTAWAIPFAFKDYLELVDWTGRLIRSDKRGFIGQGQPAILHRLGIDGGAFILHASRLLKEFGSAVGAQRQTRFLHGMRAARQVFGGGVVA